MKKSVKLFRIKIVALVAVALNAIFMASCEKEVKTETVTQYEQVLVDTTIFVDTTIYVPVGDSLPEGIYVNKVFTDIKPAVTFQYGSESHHTATFIEPVKCVKEARPLVILSPGGGWASYTEVPRLTLLANDLASRGYTVAVIQYALGPQGFDTYLKAVQDVRSAIRYFRINANNLQIDADNIFAGGWSTGAQASLAAGFVENDEIGYSGDADPLFRPC